MGRIAVGVLVAAVAAVLAPTARGAVECGTTLTTDTTLRQDIGPCPANGLTVTADNVTVDLGGHRIFGTGSPGDGVGIEILNARGVRVQNGTISNFDAGVLISHGDSNQVTNIKAIANVGLAGTTDFGDGILINSSPSNLVKGNEIRSNGPFSGISVIGAGSFGNKISKNTVQNNDVALNDVENNDVGIRLEAGTETTTLKRNVVSFSGLDGIAIFQNSTGNVLLENTVKFNGFHDKTHRQGDGIRVFGRAGPDNNLLKANITQDNAANGLILSVEATSNVIQKNKASRNGFGDPGSFDLADQNSGCDQNTWLDNIFGSRSQDCVR